MRIFHDVKGKMTNMQVLLIIGVLIVAAGYFGYITIPGLTPGQVVVPTSGTSFPTNPTIGESFYRTDLGQNYQYTSTGWTQIGGNPNTNPTTHDAATIQFVTADIISQAAVVAANTYIDISQANGGVFDLLMQSDTLTVATTPDTMNVMYADGSQVIMHVASTADPTGGLDYYDGWYYAVLHAGNPVYYLTQGMLQTVSGSPHYTYSVSTAGAQTTGSVVTWTSGTTNYWDVGKLFITPRTTAANLDWYVTYQGVTQSSMTDGSTFITGSSTANSTIAGTTDHLDCLFVNNAAGIAYGANQIILSTQGQALLYQPVIVFSTNMTAIDVGQLQAEGWSQINDNTLTSEKAFYKPLSEWITTKGSTWTQDVSIPIYDSAAASGRYVFRFWMLDHCLISNIAIGSSTTTMPTAYGFISYYGLSAKIFARAYGVTSGAGSGEAMSAWLIK